MKLIAELTDNKMIILSNPKELPSWFFNYVLERI